MKAKPSTDTTVCRNRKALFRYEVIEKLECGLMLVGSEVKSLRARTASIEEAYARIDRGELWLIGAHIPPYAHASTYNHDPKGRRKLLVHAKDIRKWTPKVEQKGLTLVPLSIYFNERGIAKVSLALCRGKTDSDKRETLKKREATREMEREMRRR